MIEFSTNTEHAGRNMTLAGQWADLAAYYRADDGTAWCFNNCTRSWSNCGSWEDFLAQFNRRYRGTLNTLTP